jgi:hypothetical protein
MKRLSVIAVMVLACAACKHDDTASVQPPPAAVTTGPTSSTPPTGTTTTTGTTGAGGGTVTPGGSTGGTTPSGSTSLVIYDDELRQGGAFLYPGGENQVLSFNDTSNPAAGSQSMRYAWNGGDVAGQHAFTGVDLIHSGDISNYGSTPGKDLRAGKYSRVTFDARGTLGANVVIKIEVADDGVQGTPAPCLVLSPNGDQDDTSAGNPVPGCLMRATLQSGWQNYSIPISANELASVKDYFKATYINKGAPASTSSGGTVFFDQIQYQP